MSTHCQYQRAHDRFVFQPQQFQCVAAEFYKSVYDNDICVPEVRKFSVCIMQLLHPSLSTPVG